MKRKQLFVAFIALMLPLAGNAQITVYSNGVTAIGPGPITSSSGSGATVLSLVGGQGQYYPLAPTMSLGTGLSIGSATGGDLDDARLIKLTGSNGFAITTGAGVALSMSVPSSATNLNNSTFYVDAGYTHTKQLYYTSLYTPSDEKYKKNVTTLSNSVSQLSKLKAIQYDLDLSNSSYMKPKAIDIPGQDKYKTEMVPYCISTR